MDQLIFSFDKMTRVQLMGVTILEPVTVATNLLIAGVCFYAFFKLKKQPETDKALQMLQLFFLAMGVASTIGGILGHGFIYLTGKYGKLPGWYCSMLAVAFFERAAIVRARPLLSAATGRFFSFFNYVEIVAFMGLAFITLQFRFVKIHATYGLFVVVFCFELFIYFKQKNVASLYIFYGTLMAALAAMTHTNKIGINNWFNYNDTSHVLMSVAVYFYFLAATNFKYSTSENRSNKRLSVICDG